jgi:rhodanese-related sulfurtransferase
MGLFALAFTTQQKPVQNISESEMTKWLDNKEYVVIDVRTPGEVKNGFIKGTDLFIDINDPAFEKKIAELDKKKNYVIYCHSGARSYRAATAMTSNGFTTVYNLSGGIMSWNNADLIVRK